MSESSPATPRSRPVILRSSEIGTRPDWSRPCMRCAARHAPQIGPAKVRQEVQDMNLSQNTKDVNYSKWLLFTPGDVGTDIYIIT